jgi:hypothetical protein
MRALYFFSIRNFWIFLAIFLTTLGSHYFYQVGVYVFQVVGLIFLIPFCRRWPLSVKSVGLLGLVYFFLYVYIINFVYLVLGINNFAGGKAVFPLLVLLCYWFVAALYSEPFRFLNALRIIITIHCLVFFIQFFSYLLFGVFLDFIEPLTGESQRAFGGSYEISVLSRFIRTTGLYNEPGTYVTYMMILLVLFKDFCILVDSQNLDRWWVEVLVITTTLLAFSNFGYIFLLIYALVVYGSLRTSKLRLLLFFSLLAAGGVVFFEYFQQRFAYGRTDTGIEFRIFGVLSFIQNLDWWEFLFGRGFSANIVFWNGEIVILQDIGMWFGLFYYFGIFGVLLFVFYLNLSLRSMPKNTLNKSYLVCLVIFLLLSKLVLTNILLLIVLFYIAIRSRIFLKFNKSSNGNLH